jgi:hypothetical protein
MWQTSFEFRQGRAYPVLTGIVIAAENEEMVTEVGVRQTCSPHDDEEKRARHTWKARRMRKKSDVSGHARKC